MSNIPPIFVISLKHSQRREVIKTRLDGLGLNFEFFDAVYGKDLTEEEIAKIDFNFYPKKYNARKALTLGEIGCAMSHILLYEYMVKHKIEQAIILEDDAIVSLYFKQILIDVLNKVPSRREIIFFDHGKAKVYLLCVIFLNVIDLHVIEFLLKIQNVVLSVQQHILLLWKELKNY